MLKGITLYRGGGLILVFLRMIEYLATLFPLIVCSIKSTLEFRCLAPVTLALKAKKKVNEGTGMFSFSGLFNDAYFMC